MRPNTEILTKYCACYYVVSDDIAKIAKMLKKQKLDDTKDITFQKKAWVGKAGNKCRQDEHSTIQFSIYFQMPSLIVILA